jgi:hypothetical protein
MLIITEATLSNPGVLETASLPKRFLGRVALFPRGCGLGVWVRLIAEVQLLRYIAPLLPFVGIALVFRELALPFTQAPLLMLIAIIIVEMRVLRLSKSARARLVAEDEAARRLDALAFRARACLRRIAARHALAEGELRLVIEQSELARIPPLTLVSVQVDRPRPRVLDLDDGDRDVLRTGLFDADLTERDLLAVNHRDDLYLRDIAQEARAVSAHARLAALLEREVAPT